MEPQARGCQWKEGILLRINKWLLFIVGLLAVCAFALRRATFTDGWFHFNLIIALYLVAVGALVGLAPYFEATALRGRHLLNLLLAEVLVIACFYAGFAKGILPVTPLQLEFLSGTRGFTHVRALEPYYVMGMTVATIFIFMAFETRGKSIIYTLAWIFPIDVDKGRPTVEEELERTIEEQQRKK
jgi:hypothetical protein